MHDLEICPKCGNEIKSKLTQKCDDCNFPFSQVKLMNFEKEHTQDILENTKAMYERVCKKKINLHGASWDNITDDTRNKTIDIGLDYDNDSVKTDFERFMAHIFYKSPNAAMNRRTSKMVTEVEENKKDLAKNLARKIYHLFENRRCESNLGENYGGFEQRAKLSRQDRQAQIVIEKELVTNGEMDLKLLKDPFTALELAEVDVDLSETDYAYANVEMSKAEDGLGRSGAIILAKEYFKKYGLKWINDMLNPPEVDGKGGKDDEDSTEEEESDHGSAGGSEQESDDGDSESEGESKLGGFGQGDDKDQDEEEDEEEDEEDSDDVEEETKKPEQLGKDYPQKNSDPWRKQKESLKQEKYLNSLGFPEQDQYPEMTKGEASDLIEKYKNMDQADKDKQDDKDLESDKESVAKLNLWNEISEKSKVNSTIKSMESFKGKDKLTDEESSEIYNNDLEKSGESGEQDIDNLDQQILAKGLMEKAPESYKFDNVLRKCWVDNIKEHEDAVELDSVKLDTGLVKHMERFFRKFKGKKREVLDEEGIDIDIDAFIDDLDKPQKECMLDESKKEGLDVIIAYDQSISMAGHKIHTVREMVATLMKAMEKSPKIKVKAIGWSNSYKDGKQVRLEIVEKWEDVAKIKTWGTAPLTEAIVFSKDYLDKMSGDKKMLFVISDGQPNGTAHTNIAKKAIRDLSRKNGSAIGIMVGDGWSSNTKMEEYFGKKGYQSFTNETDMSDFIKMKVKKQAMRYLK